MANCDPKALLEAARCFRCLPKDVVRAIKISLLCRWASQPKGCGTPSDTITISGAGTAGANQNYTYTSPGLWVGATDSTYTLNTSGAGWAIKKSGPPVHNLYYTTAEDFPCTWTVFTEGADPAPTGMYVQVDVPVNLTLPTITGTVQVGQTLSGTNGTWSNSPTGYTYRWLADGVAIGGATANTFLLTTAQIGKVITFEVTASNAGGAGTPATSAATAAVLPLPPAAVSNLTAIYKANSATEIDLAWTDNATNETEYRI